MFEKLLEELDAEAEKMAKAMTPDEKQAGDDKKIAAAADDAGNEGKPTDDKKAEGAAGAGPGEKEEDDEQDEVFGKSFEIEVDGKKMRAFDGAEAVNRLATRIQATEKDLSKALGVSVDLIRKMSVRMDTMQKALDEANKTISEIANTGRGKKSVSADLAKSLPGDNKNAVSPTEFMAKALDLQKAGKLSGFDVSLAETSLNRGLPIPERIMKAVANAE